MYLMNIHKGTITCIYCYIKTNAPFGTCIISILILKVDGSKPINITVTRNNTVFDIIKYLLLKSHTCIMCFTGVIKLFTWHTKADDPLLKYLYGKQTIRPVVNIFFIDSASELYVQSLTIPWFLFGWLTEQEFKINYVTKGVFKG